jgi:hypothetical protein
MRAGQKTVPPARISGVTPGDQATGKNGKAINRLAWKSRLEKN